MIKAPIIAVYLSQQLLQFGITFWFPLKNLKWVVFSSPHTWGLLYSACGLLQLNILIILNQFLSCADRNPLVIFEGIAVVLAKIIVCFTFNVNKEHFYTRILAFMVIC